MTDISTRTYYKEEWLLSLTFWKLWEASQSSSLPKLIFVSFICYSSFFHTLCPAFKSRDQFDMITGLDYGLYKLGKKMPNLRFAQMPSFLFTENVIKIEHQLALSEIASGINRLQNQLQKNRMFSLGLSTNLALKDKVFWRAKNCSVILNCRSDKKRLRFS